jgi:excisionase family DNA binding protein
MAASTRQPASDQGAGPRYGPTPAAPGSGTSQPTAATPLGGEVPTWPPGKPDGCVQATGWPRPTGPTPPDRPAEFADALAQLPEVLTVKEAAAVLRVGRNQLYAAVDRREQHAIRIGRTIRIPKTAPLDLLIPAPNPFAKATTSP